MTVALRVEPPPDDPDFRFPSLAALRDAHTDLLEHRGESDTPPELLPEITHFLRRGRATGVLLDAPSDRRMVQSLLDYWATLLYRLDRRLVEATLADFDPELAPTLDDNDRPYVGLDAFLKENHPRFFGRQGLIEQLIAKLSDHRLLAVIGASGSGKSSLVLGGLLPSLEKAGALPDSKTWRYLPRLVPGSEPLVNLAAAVLPPGTDAKQIGEVAASFLHNPRHLAELATGDQPWVVVIDQFEELFTLCDDEAARQAFAQSLRDLVDVPRPRHIILLTLRSDYEKDVKRLPALQPLFENGQVRVTPLIASELREAIEKPAELVGLKFEEGLVDALVYDLLGDPAGLPLLQFTLLKLWESRDHNRVTREAYGELGSGRLALANCAQKFFDEELSPAEQVTAKRILLRMVRPSESLEFTSSRVRRETLHQTEDPGRVERVLNKLVGAHLVRLTRGKTPADDQVEVAHEAMVRNWPTLMKWLEDERAQFLIRRRWEAQAEEWVRLGRGGSGLLDEVQLFEIERWLQSADAVRLGYSETLPQLVKTSREALERRRAKEEAARQWKMKRLRQYVAALAILLLATIIASSVAFTKQRQIRAEKEKVLYAQLQLFQHQLADKEEEQRIARLAQKNHLTTLPDALTALSAQKDQLEQAHFEKAEAITARDQAIARAREKEIQLNAERVEARDALERLRGEKDASDVQWAKQLKAEKTLREAAESKIRDAPVVPGTQGPSALATLPRTRPLRMGISVGSEAGPAGSLCCFVRDKNDHKQIYLLSLASVFQGPIGSAILQPARQRGGTAADRVAVLSKVGIDPVRSGAIAKLQAEIKIDTNIPRLGGIQDHVHVGDNVRLFTPQGKGKEGTVLKVNDDVAVISISTTPEELGAPVLATGPFKREHDLVGMVYASEVGKSSVIRIKHVQRELGVELCDARGKKLD